MHCLSKHKFWSSFVGIAALLNSCGGSSDDREVGTPNGSAESSSSRDTMTEDSVASPGMDSDAVSQPVADAVPGCDVRREPSDGKIDDVLAQQMQHGTEATQINISLLLVDDSAVACVSKEIELLGGTVQQTPGVDARFLFADLTPSGIATLATRSDVQAISNTVGTPPPNG